MQLRLQEAYDLALAAERLALNIDGGHVPGVAKGKVMQAVVLVEWNRLDEAMELLNGYLYRIESAGQVSIAQQGYLAMARCHTGLGRHGAALKSLERCLQISLHTNCAYINIAVQIEISEFRVITPPCRERLPRIGESGAAIIEPD